MKTSEEVAAEFKQKLIDLLDEYDAEMTIEDNGCYIRDPVMMVCINGKYNENGDTISEYVDVNFGRWIGK